MRIPIIRGVIDRRVLVTFRIEPDVLKHVLPAPFRPHVFNGFGIGGICLIRLKQIRPRFLPAFAGISSENAAHRIAVEWNHGDQTRTGVFIPRRDTSSWLNAFAGGRLFPGVHHRAHFDVRESDTQFRIAMDSVDDLTQVLVEGSLATELPADSIFSVENVSRFYEAGSLGYSPGSSAGEFDGLELRTSSWHIEPLSIAHVQSSFFEDRHMFPEGTVTFDNALLMRGIDHEWHSLSTLCCRD